VGDVKLWNADCLQAVQFIPDGGVDMVLCDPPYGIDFQSRRKKDRSEWKPKIANDKTPFTGFVQHLPRILSDKGCVMVFTRWDVQQVFIDELTSAGLKPKNVLIWDKVIHGMGDLKRAFGSRYESIIFCARDNFRFPGKRPTDIIRVQRVDAQKLVHPNEKPVELQKQLILDCTSEHSTVLDCFMGSGSTGVACVNTNRNFIGIELDENYYKIAKQRIEEAQSNAGNA
jgi:DNA modification methylase